MGGTFIVIQQYPVVLLYHQIVSYGVFLGENLCDCRTAFVRFFFAASSGTAMTKRALFVAR